MSKAKDRARAESGQLFRDGKLVNKEDWYAAHPTREMRIAQQAGVDKALADIVLAKQQGIVVAKEIPHRYYCTACRRYHTLASQIGKEHMNFYLEEA